MALPAELWPSDTKAFFGENYSASTGNWVDDMGIASNITQATSGSRPTEDTTTAPSGRKMLSSDTTKWLNTGGQIPTGSLASWATGKWVEFFILKLFALQDDDFYRFIDYSNSGVEDYYLHFFGKLWRWALQSDASLDLNVTRVIFVADASTGDGLMYLNNSLQAGTATGIGSGMRTQWTGAKSVFATSSGTEGSNCLIGCHGYIQRATFGSTEVASLDAAMSEWWSTAPSGSPQNVSGAGAIASLEAMGRPNVIGGAPFPRKLFRQYPNLVFGRGRAFSFGGLPLVYGMAKNSPAQQLADREFWGGVVAPTGISSAETFGTASISNVGGGGAQSITGAGNIASAQAFGVAKLNQTVRGTGIATAEQLGNAKLNLRTIMTGIASLEAMGAAKLNINAKPTGIVSSEAIGTAKLNRNAKPTGIPTAEAIGTASVTRLVKPTGIASAEGLGTAKLNRTAPMTGIASAQAFGASKLNVNVKPTGIATAEAVGSATATTGPVSIRPTGIATAEAVGTAKLNRNVKPTGLTSAEAFGTTRFTIYVKPTGIGSAQAFGSTTVVPGPKTLSPTGITSGQAFGAPVLTLGGNFIFASGIASAQAMGAATVQPGPVQVHPTGIGSGQAFGAARFVVTVKPTGIASAQAMGAPVVHAGGVSIAPTGIVSGQAFGNPALSSGPALIAPTGISSAEVFDSNYSPLLSNPTSFFYRPSYTVAGGWPATAGDPLITDGFGVPPPSNGGFPVTDGGVYASLQAQNHLVSEWGGAGDKTLYALVDFISIDSEETDIWLGGALLGDLYGLYLGLFVRRTGTPGNYRYWLSYYEWDGDQREARTEITALLDANGGGLLAAQGRKVNGHVQVRANGLPWVVGDACGDTEDVTGHLATGYTYPGFHGTVRSLGTWNRAITDRESDGLYTFAIGGLRLNQYVMPNGIVPATMFGSTRLVYAQTLATLAIPSSEAFGTIAISGGDLQLPPLIRWSLRPATTIVVRFRPATIINVTHRPATLITVRQRNMALYVDDVNEVVFTFQHPDTKAYIDPPSVLLVVQSPTQAETDVSTTYTYGVGTVISKTATGKYTARIPCTESGSWSGAPKCTGAAAASGRFYFEVEEKI